LEERERKGRENGWEECKRKKREREGHRHHHHDHADCGVCSVKEKICIHKQRSKKGIDCNLKLLSLLLMFAFLCTLL